MHVTLEQRKDAPRKVGSYRAGEVFGHGTLNSKPMWCMRLSDNDYSNSRERAKVVELDSGRVRPVDLEDLVVPAHRAVLNIEY